MLMNSAMLQLITVIYIILFTVMTFIYVHRIRFKNISYYFLLLKK